MDEYEMQAFELERELWDLKTTFPRSQELERATQRKINYRRKKSRTYRAPLHMEDPWTKVQKTRRTGWERMQEPA